MSDTTLVRGCCPHDCPDTCATIAEVKGGRAIRFYADPQHPTTQGWLCAKVRPYLERVYAEDRLTHPLRRVGPKGSGQWERISWQEAIDAIASRWQSIIASHGAGSILPYSYSGTLGLLQNAVAAERLWNRMGACGLDRGICGAAAEHAVQSTLGARHAPDAEDVLHSQLVLIWGHNPASTGPHFMPKLREAQRRGAFVVVIDPRRTITARAADLHLRPNPASDGALALGLMHVIFAEQLHDEPWLEANTVGWRELRERCAAFPPERVSAISGIPAETIVDLARRYAAASPALLKFADGLQRHANGGQTVRALCCLPALTGQYGKLGGGLSYSTSGYARWDERSIGHADECPPTPRTVSMNRLGATLLGEADPPIMSLFVFAANPVTSTPNSAKVIEGLLRDDLFTVVHELFMTDTARYADIVLPATSQLEHLDLHKAYGHRNLQWNAPAIAPLAECRSNWDVMRALAAAMGYNDPWLQEDAETAIATILDASAAANPYLAGITVERLKREGTVPLSFAEGDAVPFARLRFPTPSGKVELWCANIASEGEDPLPNYIEPAEFAARAPGQLILISGASHHFVSGTFGNQPSLRRRAGEPFVEINPADAAARGIADGQTVRLENARGWCTLRAAITDDVPPGTAVAPKGYWASRSPDGRNVNYLTPDTLADFAGQSTFHSNLVEIRPA